MIDNKLKELGYNWQSYSKIIGENPSNFKRKLIQNIEKINKWLAPLNLEIQIVKKSKNPESY